MDNAAWAGGFIDGTLKLALLGGFAAVATRNVGPGGAAAAHRAWLLILCAPFALAISAALLPPLVLVVPHPSLTPVVDTVSQPGMLSRGLQWLITAWPAIYLTVTMALAVRLVAGVYRVRRLVRDSAALTALETAVVHSATPIARDLHLRSSRLGVPVTAGMFAPVVLSPSNWATLSRTELAAILQHEHAHVRRHDYAWGLFAAVVETCCWFHPVVWIAGSRLRWFAEVASDHEAAEALGAREYAGELVGLAERWSRERRIRYAVTVGAGSALGRRIQLLIDTARPHAGQRLLIATVIAIVLATATMSAVRFTLRASDARSLLESSASGSHTIQHLFRHHH